MERHVKALKKLEYEAIKQLRVNYYVELHALDMKYQQLFVPLDQQVPLLTYCYFYYYYYYYYTRLTACFPGQPGLAGTRNVKSVWILMRQEITGFWDAVASAGPYMRTICTSLQTDNHTSTSSLNFFSGQMLFLMPYQ